MSQNYLISVYLNDFIGVLLLFILLLTRGWSIPGRKDESRIIVMLIIATFIDCVSDPFVFTMDGQPGLLNHIIVVVGNSILYLYNIVMGTGMLALIVRHINKTIPKLHYIIVYIISVGEVLLIVVNLFIPVVFSVDENNVYSRGPAYFVYIICAVGLLIYVNIFYFIAKKRDHFLRYFPVWEFVLPIAIGVGLQTVFYGISVQPVCFAIAYTGIIINLQNESLYLDKLTGVYNRYELDKIMEKLEKKKKDKIAAVMLDMNGFKQINDNYSHAEGDRALVAIAGILSNVVKNDGVVIRFAGDEFIVIVNDFSENIIEELERKINVGLDAYNTGYNKPYQLSVSMGGDIFDFSKSDSETCLKAIDKMMYDNKREYYKTHDRRGERKS